MDYYYSLHRLIKGAPYSDVPPEHTCAWLIGQIDCAYKFELISSLEADKLSRFAKKCYLEWLVVSPALSDVFNDIYN